MPNEKERRGTKYKDLQSQGLGGLRNAGPATAGPRPPYVIEAHGYAVQRLRPYGPYGLYKGRNI
ncbi:hypothetical protein L249_7057, partial [Ophiocordyceps polyrhachis-furcata BCC 54312]